MGPQVLPFVGLEQFPRLSQQHAPVSFTISGSRVHPEGGGSAEYSENVHPLPRNVPARDEPPGHVIPQ